MLTGGQTYYYAVRATTPLGVLFAVEDFETPLIQLPSPTLPVSRFQHVTVLTPGIVPENTTSPEQIATQLWNMAAHLYEQDSAVMQYQRSTGTWQLMRFDNG